MGWSVLEYGLGGFGLTRLNSTTYLVDDFMAHLVKFWMHMSIDLKHVHGFNINQICEWCRYWHLNSFVSLFSIDASTTDRIAKYIRNSSKKESNCIPRPCFMAGMPRVLFYASKEIDAGSELRCYYGLSKNVSFTFESLVEFALAWLFVRV